ncbi:MAG: alpha/beta hydrolase [Acidobacteriota bacterium]|nr:alpha/beta hydrolase [Acidobacteriota bacterium]
MQQPEWFRQALAMKPEEGQTSCDGAKIRYLTWGDPSKKHLMLVHGGSAHAQWWSFLAPLLTDRYYVTAPHLSGHGDSDRRPVYEAAFWPHEVHAVMEDAGLHRPMVVGHSLGGLVAAGTAALYGQEVSGCVIVDSPVKPPKPKNTETGGRQFGAITPYPTYEEAVNRFRLLPAQPCENPYIMQYLAETSLREVEEGWIWKFDPNVFSGVRAYRFEQYFKNLKGPLAYFRGEYSKLAPPEGEAILAEKVGRRIPFITIPDSYHHLILDQPLAFITALRTLFTCWDF